MSYTINGTEVKVGQWVRNDDQNLERVFCIGKASDYVLHTAGWDKEERDYSYINGYDAKDMQTDVWLATAEQCDAAGVPNTPEHRPCEEQRTAIAYRYFKSVGGGEFFRRVAPTGTDEYTDDLGQTWHKPVTRWSINSFLNPNWIETDASGKPLAPPEPVKPDYSKLTTPKGRACNFTNSCLHWPGCWGETSNQRFFVKRDGSIIPSLAFHGESLNKWRFPDSAGANIDAYLDKLEAEEKAKAEKKISYRADTVDFDWVRDIAHRDRCFRVIGIEPDGVLYSNKQGETNLIHWQQLRQNCEVSGSRAVWTSGYRTEGVTL